MIVLRICYLSDASSVHTKKWCKFFINKGYDIHVISLNDGVIEGATVHSLALNVEDIKKDSSYKKGAYLKNIFKVRKLVKEIKPDILHAHYASSYGTLGWLCKFKPYILSVWGSDIYDFPKQNIFFKQLIKYNLNKAELIFSTSKAMAAETNKYTPKEIIVTPFGVDTNKFKRLDNQKDAKEYITIGTIKTLEKKYGIDYLIKAFALLCEKGYNMRLEIYGSGSEGDNLRKLASDLKVEDKVLFGGYITEEQVVNKFNSFDIAVFPSTLDSESFGVAAVEAEACGVPVVISDTPGLMEATKPGETSLVAKKKDYEDLADKIEKFVVDKKLRVKFANNAIKYVEDNYDLTKNFEKVENIYFHILKKKEGE